MKEYKKEFCDFLWDNDSFKIGNFRLKDGRESPYFIDTGVFYDGESIQELGEYYASEINDKFQPEDYDVIFGPACKGVPISVSTVISLKEKNINKRYLFDRKVPKDYGEVKTKEDFAKKWLVGEIKDGDKILIVDDVFTTGRTKYDSLELLDKSARDLEFSGIVIAVDRQEVRSDGKNAIKDFTDGTGIPVESIAKITEIVKYLFEENKIDEQEKENIKKYLEEYGTQGAREKLRDW